MRIPYFFLSFFILTSLLLHGQPQTLEGSATLKESIDRLMAEVDEIKNFVATTREKNKKIKNFKIKVTNVVTNLAASNHFNMKNQKSFIEMERIEDEVNRWARNEKKYSEHLTDLLVFIEKSLTSYKGFLLGSKGEQRYSISQSINELTRLRTRLRNYEVSLNYHRREIESFLDGAKNFKNLLKERIDKSFTETLFDWKVNNALFSPIENIKKLSNKVRESWGNIKEKVDSFSVKEVLSVSFLLLCLFVIFWALSFFVLKKLEAFNTSFGGLIKEGFIGEIFPYFLQEKIIVSSWFGFLATQYISFNVISYKLSFVFFIFFVSLFFFTILRVRRKMLEPIGKIVGIREKKWKLLVILWGFFLVTFSRVFSRYIYIESEILHLFDTLILGGMSLILLKPLARLFLKKWDKRDLYSEVLRGIVIFFLGVLLLSSLLEVIGFVYLGRAIQGVVLDNVFVFVWLWFVFKTAENLLKSYGENYVKKITYNADWLDLVDFIRRSINKFLIFLIFILIMKGWMKNVFVYSNLGNISLLSFGEYNLRLSQLLIIISLYYIFKISFLLFRFTFNSFIFRYWGIEKKNSHNILSIVRYLMIFLFISVAIGILGFTYKNILIFASALGVGIGFGLQNIVNNFLSGVIILFEQPIRVGDVIEVNGIFSVVDQIGIRSTVVDTLDNSSIVIPNSEIVSNHLVNWTLKDNVIAQNCEVGVEYGVDTRLVSGLLLEVLKSSRGTLEEPAPQIWFTEFGDSSLNFVVRYWINKPKDRDLIKSKVMHDIYKQLETHNISIPFPQRDLHIYPQTTSTGADEESSEES